MLQPKKYLKIGGGKFNRLAFFFNLVFSSNCKQKLYSAQIAKCLAIQLLLLCIGCQMPRHLMSEHSQCQKRVKSGSKSNSLISASSTVYKPPNWVHIFDHSSRISLTMVPYLIVFIALSIKRIKKCWKKFQPICPRAHRLNFSKKILLAYSIELWK